MSKKKYICIHGHFYQPPRENAWLEVVEQQESAHPYHDWNSRINFECYAPNASARVLDSTGAIINIINNYSKISFNFGPTLLSWMAENDKTTYNAILEADKISQTIYGGHGNALAQVHSHVILPLANENDKETQVLWGIRDFEYRFKRKPEGMWLAETAVDTATLETLVDNDIKFTILAPRQAKAFRKVGSKEWEYTHSIDTRRAYLFKLPSGRSIILFFYNGDVAQDVAFNGLLNNGKALAHRLVYAFSSDPKVELVNIATDGESYGHHHRFGEMALADCLSYIEEKELATLINYAQYAELHPPQMEVLIHENSSWSCVHGVERWQNDCGCSSGGHPKWNQQWRKPLREALNWLRDELIVIFEKESAKFVKSPWDARNGYIDVILDRSDLSIENFLKENSRKKLTEEQKITLLRLMEMQRNAIYMFTSCGWFFDEISGIETNQILQYACRAVEYAKQVAGVDYQKDFIKRLAQAPSNVFSDGAYSYKKHVLTARVDLMRVGMHYAVSSLFEAYPQQLTFFNYIATSELYENKEAGNFILAVGRTKVKSQITLSEKDFSFAVLYLGQQNIIGNIALDLEREKFDDMQVQIFKAFDKGNLGEVIGIMQTYFGTQKYSINHLFHDEKQKVMTQVMLRNFNEAEVALRDIYKNNYQLMTSMLQSNFTIPNAYKNVVQIVVNADMHNFFEREQLNIERLQRYADEIKKWKVSVINEQSLRLTASERIFREIKELELNNVPITKVQNINSILRIMQDTGVELDIWQSQNVYFSMLQGLKAGSWVFASEAWRDAFTQLGELLKMKMMS